AQGKVRELGPRSDVYAIGATLYALLTGVPPFRAATPLATGLLALSADPEPPSRRRPGLPRELEAVCLRCLCKEPHERYPSAAARPRRAAAAGRGRAGRRPPRRPGRPGRAAGLAARRPRRRRGARLAAEGRRLRRPLLLGELPGAAAGPPVRRLPLPRRRPPR